MSKIDIPKGALTKKEEIALIHLMNKYKNDDVFLLI